MATKILKCDCKHEFQDKQYGKGNRVHNESTKDKLWRCTICEKTRAS